MTPLPYIEIWRNAGAGFTNIDAGLPAVSANAAWGDHDNDGRPDILLAGITSNFVAVSQVWRNTENGFIDIRAGLPGVLGSVAWGDYDNDGRLDVLLAGRGTNDVPITELWRNTGNRFSRINVALPGLFPGSAAWVDYNNDGRLDILLTGLATNDVVITELWRNTGNGFSKVNAGLPGIVNGSVSWGDYDNDGRLDVLLTGRTSQYSGNITELWRNTSSGFIRAEAGLPGFQDSSAAWGDFDNDGRLDILVTGNDPSTGRVSQVWRNNTANTNTPPDAPSGLKVTLAGETATFSWNAANDAETPPAGLTYNVRVGITPGGSQIVNPMSAADGTRRLPEMGNAQKATFRMVRVPPGRPLYWSVQAVDTAFAGSPFAAEQSFTYNSVLTPPSGIPVAGDTDGDGMVSQAEFESILANYWSTSPFLQMTNVAGLGGTNVTFALSNSALGAFSVEYTTNFVNWWNLGPATPRYEFTDTNAPAVPQRHYRLRWP